MAEPKRTCRDGSAAVDDLDADTVFRAWRKALPRALLRGVWNLIVVIVCLVYMYAFGSLILAYLPDVIESMKNPA